MKSLAQSRIAILGAGGFLGSHIVEALLPIGCTIKGVDLHFEKIETRHARLELEKGDLRTPGLLERAVSDADIVLSLTALCNPALYNTRPLEVIDASYTHLVPVVEMCCEQKKWLVHFSTSEVYGRVAVEGDGQRVSHMNESSTGFFLGPVHMERWTYACAKQLLERLIWAYGKHHGLAFTVVRPFNVIGARMDFLPGIDGSGVPRVLACFIHALMSGEPLQLVDGGNQRRSFVYVADFVDAVVRILQRPDRATGHVFNIGSPENDTTIAGLANLIAQVWAEREGGPVPQIREVSAEDFYGEGYDDSTVRIPNIDAARNRLEWEPTTGLREMLPPVLDDYIRRYRSRVEESQRS